MKTILIIFLLSLASSAFSKPVAICSYRNAKKVIPTAESHSKNDKNRHCAVSCMLTLRCPSGDVRMAGILKEIQDFFGAGNAERADLEANSLGIDLADLGIARTDKECLQKCDLYYSP